MRPEAEGPRDAAAPADRTMALPRIPQAGPVRQVRPEEETAVLPPVGRQGADPAGRVPEDWFRPEPATERTRELPQVDPDQSAARRRPRPTWAEETPMDDLPSLADELLGPRDERGDGRGNERGDDQDGNGPRDGRRRR